MLCPFNKKNEINKTEINPTLKFPTIFIKLFTKLGIKLKSILFDKLKSYLINLKD